MPTRSDAKRHAGKHWSTWQRRDDKCAWDAGCCLRVQSERDEYARTTGLLTRGGSVCTSWHCAQPTFVDVVALTSAAVKMRHVTQRRLRSSDVLQNSAKRCSAWQLWMRHRPMQRRPYPTAAPRLCCKVKASCKIHTTTAANTIATIAEATFGRRATGCFQPSTSRRRGVHRSCVASWCKWRKRGDCNAAGRMRPM